MMMPGTPGSVAPMASRPGACRCAKYQTFGAVSPRCGSFASSGLPLVLCAPETAQLFDAPAMLSAAETCAGSFCSTP